MTSEISPFALSFNRQPNKLISAGQNICIIVVCRFIFGKKNTDKNTITRQELYVMVWNESLTAISKRLNIPYLHLRKICKEMQVPVPPNGHWSKLQFHKTVEIFELPEYYSGTNEIKLYPSQKDISKPEVLTFHKKTAVDLIQEDKTLPLTFPKTLTNPTELVVKAQKRLAEYSFNAYNDQGMVRYDGAFTIRVSRGNIGRALRFMDTLIKLLRARGHKLDTKFTNSLVIDEVTCEFKIMEKTKKSDQVTKWGSVQYESTEHLKLTVALTDDLTKWLKWAKDKVDWYDPLINKEDLMLNVFDKSKLF